MRWLLEVPVTSLWSEAHTQQKHMYTGAVHALYIFRTNSLNKLAREGCALDGTARHALPRSLHDHPTTAAEVRGFPWGGPTSESAYNTVGVGGPVRVDTL